MQNNANLFVVPPLETTGTLPASRWLAIDSHREAERIASTVREQIHSRLKRNGAVVGLSGGVDSSVVAALCTRALGSDRVLGLIMPERDSAPESKELALAVTESLGIQSAVVDITDLLEAAGCYKLRDEAIRIVFPQYGPEDRCKLILSSLATGARYSVPSLVVVTPGGRQHRVRLNAASYLQIVAATNFKQRVRAMMEYYYADRLHYAVVGTPNRLEYDQGFFVKHGDGAADLKPITHLYKSQVFDMADYFDLPAGVRRRACTTDTFSMHQSQEEFFFGVPLRTLDLCLYAKNHDFSVSETAAATSITAEEVEAVFSLIDSKRRATAYLHEPPLLAEEVPLACSSD